MLLTNYEYYNKLQPASQPARIEWINVIRGIVIILMLVGHSGPPTSIMTFIYGFHMPFFFMLSGYLFNFDKWEKLGLKKLIVSKFKAYMIPYFFLCFINLIINFPIDFHNVGKSEIINCTIGRIFWIFYSMGKNAYMPNCTPLWFLPCLFIAIIYLFALLKVNNCLKVILLFCGIVLNVMLNFFNIPQLPWHFEVACVGTFFMYLGYLIHKKDVLNKDFSFITISIVFLISLNFIMCNGMIDMDARVFNNIFLALPGASLMSFLLLYCAHRFDLKNRFFSFIGKNTILIMAFNFAVNTYSRILWRRISFLSDYQYNWFLMSLVDVIICSIVILIWNRIIVKYPKFAFTIGKVKN